ncbi:uncharacterized protein BDZ99DRAFT_467916 [Mytilinidion resinicola]|uniref:Haloacid dehalogenase n=1 Tax=Mytilinidion resinicola TaxID=574789 RepID=A0A6A6Y4L9_9PEZI|nr:uncharacterized protein BDZ99DRAFT_467916 [Mytilinidion resinicola]KAF2803791.1 hypothetical protein BDZ99DRAFT_467916 [Mytilinidion resinicola]
MPPKKNLFLAFDAFGTLFTPRAPVAVQYAEVARRHGIEVRDEQLEPSFRRAFKEEAKERPNYGKAVGMGARAWWGGVITKTLTPFLAKDQPLPDALVSDLLTRFSTEKGYTLYPDVLPFFRKLRDLKARRSGFKPTNDPWRWDRTVVGVITNSDDRVPGILASLGLRVAPKRFGVPSNVQRFEFEKKVGDDVSFVVMSYDVGFEKPDRRIFDAAKELLKETLAESDADVTEEDVEDFQMLYVGDDVRKDYFGAGSAGWSAVVLDREERFAKELEGKAVAMVETRIEGDKEEDPLRKVAVIKDLRSLYGTVDN